ncbi:HSP-interacting protein isoform X1 [Cinnamomum micranthum f. kanehirae]|uniref:HSP-interacting protein isoform X1 n=1 Tax=Cinnamomum micranthum f. kanehirae TaxID=337451 RepID=A0A443PJW4_9MAGN|nr:HSP-interacting protein isoform X1 [Cinnamomum micranthum f. kanehirae]
MTALSLFNWGNVHMSQARKRVLLTEDGSRESVLAQVKTAYERAESEYVKAGEKYRESVKFNPHFYEGHLALGQQQFELAKLSCVQQSITEGTKIWMKSNDKHKELSKMDKGKMVLQKMGLDELLEDISPEEVEEMHACILSDQPFNGHSLFFMSVWQIEYKLGIQFWDETLNMALENFQAAGASKIDTDVMKKNHCSETAHKGLGYDIDEIAQAWSEMYDVKRWMSGILSFPLEPLL